MKNIARNFLSGAAVFAVISLATVAFAEDVPQFVTVYSVKGDARYSTDNKTWKTVKVGDVLKPGTVIQTAVGSGVDVTMGGVVIQTTSAPAHKPGALDLHGTDNGALPPASSTAANAAGGGGDKGNLIHIDESSVLAIDKLVVQKNGEEEVSETQLDLRAGQIMGNVKKLSAASRYEVKIPNGVAGIRGTIYQVSASGVVYCLEGQVIISYVNSQGQLVTATISAGQNFNPFGGPSGATATTNPTLNTALLTKYNTMNGGAPTPSETTTVPGPGDSTTTIHITSQ